MRNKYRILYFLIIFSLMLPLLPGTKVSASSASIIVSLVSDQAVQGDNCTLAVTVSADTTISSVEMLVTYDEKYLELVSENPLYQSEVGAVFISDSDLAGKSIKQRKYILHFKALKKGKTTIAVDGTPTIYESTNSTALSCSKKAYDLTIYHKDKKSDNNLLSSLSVKEGKLRSDFDPKKAIYEMDVPYEKKNITVKAVAEDKDATVAVTGDTDLKLGANKVSIVVTSHSGKENEYIIYVNRENTDNPNGEGEGNGLEPSQAPSISSTPIPSMTPVPGIELQGGNSYFVDKQNGLTYYQGSSSYLILTPYDDSNVPDGYKQISLTLSGQEVTAYAIDGNVYQDFVLLYAKQEGQDPGWYQFDQTEGTIQRFHEGMKQNADTIVNKEESAAKDEDSIEMLGLVIGIEACFIILMLILVIRMYMKQKGYNDELE